MPGGAAQAFLERVCVDLNKVSEGGRLVCLGKLDTDSLATIKQQRELRTMEDSRVVVSSKRDGSRLRGKREQGGGGRG
jgi:hypothetical protein